MTQTEIENRPAFGYNRATEAKKRQAKESGESAMFTLLILADDFTGALDTGVQISKTGARTVVLTDPHADLERFADETEVLVIDAETRHIPPQQAKACVASIARRAFAMKVPCIYKKTDSALRGNIGAELEAVAEEKLLHMLPEEFQPVYAPILTVTDPETERLVKAADKLSAYIKCVEELKAGNSEFRDAAAQTRAALEEYELPEVAYFLETFMPSFSLTLDQLK